MATYNSLNAALSLAVQTDKDTAALFNFVTGMLASSQLAAPKWDVLEAGEEHPAPSSLATGDNSFDERVGYLVPMSSGGALYPNFIGMLLRGVGFDVSTVDNTGYYTHTFTLAASSDVEYLTALWSLGTGGNAFERRSTGVRLTSVGINATPKEITVSAEGNGLTDSAAAGTEAKSGEQLTKLLPTLGTASFQIGGADITTNKYRTGSLTLAQGVDTEDYALWTSGRVDMPQNSIKVTGSFGGIDTDYTAYKKINWGGAGGTGPDYDPVDASLTWSWRSANNISGEAVPFSIQVAIPHVQLTFAGDEASGSGRVRFGFDYTMINVTGSEPITITLVNTHASYDYESS